MAVHRNRSPLRVHRQAVLLLLAALAVQGCSPRGESPMSDATSSPTTSTTIHVTTTAGSAAAPELPDPIAAWSLRGNGAASFGDNDLEFFGGYQVTESGAAFDGVTGQAIAKGPSPLDTTKSLTVSAWVSHPDQLTDVPVVVSQDTVALAITGFVWAFDVVVPNGEVLVEGPATISNDWVFVVGVSDRDAGVIRLYVDGKLIDEAPTAAPVASSMPVHIGGALDSGNFWAGAIADVALYQTALSEAQIAEMFHTTRPDGPAPAWTPDPFTYGDGVLNGIWDYPLTEEDDAVVLSQLRAAYGKGFTEASIRIGFDGPRFWQGVVIDGELATIDGEEVGAVGMITTDQDELTVTEWGVITTHRFVIDGNVLTIQFINECDRQTDECFTRDERLATDPFVIYIMEHSFVKSGDDPSY